MNNFYKLSYFIDDCQDLEITPESNNKWLDDDACKLQS